MSVLLTRDERARCARGIAQRPFAVIRAYAGVARIFTSCRALYAPARAKIP